MGDVHVCQGCGFHSKKPENLCSPEQIQANFVCVGCGRVADLPGKLCNPRDLELLARNEPPRTIF